MWPGLQAARYPNERRKAFLTGWADKLRDLRFTVKVVGSSLSLDTHVIDRTRSRVEHLAVSQLETEVTVDVDCGRLAVNLAQQAGSGLLQAAECQLGTALFLLENLDRLSQFVNLRL